MEPESPRPRLSKAFTSQKLPLLPYKHLTAEDPSTLSKRYPKYIDKLSLLYHHTQGLKLKCIKKIHTVDLNHPQALHPFDTKRIKRSRLLKLLKLHRRFIRQFLKPDDKHSNKLLRHLPYLSPIRLELGKHASWNYYRIHFHFKCLILRLDEVFSPRSINVKALKTHIQRLMGLKRSLKLGILKDLTIVFNDKVSNLVPTILAELNKLPLYLPTLETFALLYRDTSDRELLWVSGHITKLLRQPSSGLISGFLKDFYGFVRGNIPVIYQKEEKVDQMYNFSGLEKLEEVKIGVSVLVKKDMNTFFANFSLPKMVESVQLDLSQVAWSTIIPKTPLEVLSNYQQFLSQWETLENLKHIKFILKDQEKGMLIVKSFILPILKRLTKLQTISYENGMTDQVNLISIGNAGSFAVAPVYPLDFAYLWEGIKASESSLRHISVTDVKIKMKNFENIEVNLPNLLVLKLTGEICENIDVGGLVTKLFLADEGINNPFEASIKHWKFDDDNSFKEFLAGLSQVPRNGTVNLRANVKNVDPGFLKAELGRFLEEEKVRGKICLRLYNMDHVKSNEMQWLEKKAIENPKFGYLCISTVKGTVVLNVHKRLLARK